MEIKSIYNRNGILTHEYKVNGSDVKDIITDMNLDSDLADSLKSYLDGNNCILVKRNNDYVLKVDGKEYSNHEIEDLLDKDDIEEPTTKSYSKFKKGL